MDERLLQRVDWLVTVVSVWLLLSLVLASFALMAIDLAIGLVALTTVVLTGIVTIQSFLRSNDDAPDVTVDVR